MGALAGIVAFGAIGARSAPSANRVLRDGEHFPTGFVVPPGEAWELAPRATVTTAGNVVVHGTLRAYAPDPSDVRTLRFVEVDESQVVGGDTHGPVASDVGLWVVGAGRLDLQGAKRKPWTRSDGDASWAADDEIGVVPGREPYPDVRANLTRNLRIEGTPQGYAHVFVRNDRPVTHALNYVQLRYMGPGGGLRERADLGRYALHFHLCGGYTNGSTVLGTVARDCGSHAFVPHGSQGIDFSGAIAWDAVDTPFWWNPGDATGPERSADGTVWSYCLASNVRGYTDAPHEPVTLAGFRLGQSAAGICRHSVASNVRGSAQASGFSWPAGAAPSWRFGGCQASRCENGIFSWQDTADETTELTDFVALDCARAGVEHSGSTNTSRYEGVHVAGCQTGLELHTGSLRFERVHVEDALVGLRRRTGDATATPVEVSWRTSNVRRLVETDAGNVPIVRLVDGPAPDAIPLHEPP